MSNKYAPPQLNYKNLRYPDQKKLVGDHFGTGNINKDGAPILGNNDTEAENGNNILYEFKSSGGDEGENNMTTANDYSLSLRFRPPPSKFKHFAGYGLRFLIAEFLATTIFLTAAYLVQSNLNLVYGKFNVSPATPTAPTNTDLFFASVVKGMAAFVCLYVFWNWGKPLFNPALTFGYWWLGHITFLDMVFRWVVQFAASLLSLAMVFGFTYIGGSGVGSFIDPSVGVGPINLAGHNAGFHALWEFLGSFVLGFLAIWAYSNDKLYKEGATMAMAYMAHMRRQNNVDKSTTEQFEGTVPVTSQINAAFRIAPKANNYMSNVNDVDKNVPITVPTAGDGSDMKNHPALGTFAIPAEYQQVGGGPIVSFQVSFVVGISYIVLDYLGYIVTGGDGSLNFLLWFPRVINLSGQNWNLAIPMGIQGSIYFFSPFAGVLLTGLLSFLLIYITRRWTFGTMDQAMDIDNNEAPHAY